MPCSNVQREELKAIEWRSTIRSRTSGRSTPIPAAAIVRPLAVTMPLTIEEVYGKVLKGKG